MKTKVIHAVKGDNRKPDTVIMMPRCGAKAPYTSLTCNNARVTCPECLRLLREWRA